MFLGFAVFRGRSHIEMQADKPGKFGPAGGLLGVERTNHADRKRGRIPTADFFRALHVEIATAAHAHHVHRRFQLPGFLFADFVDFPGRERFGVFRGAPAHRFFVIVGCIAFRARFNGSGSDWIGDAFEISILRRDFQNA